MGDVMWHDRQRASIYLYGPLPAALPLLDIQRGDSIDVLNHMGRTLEYSEGVFCMRFCNIRDIQYNIDIVAALNSDESERMDLHMSCVAYIEFTREGADA